MINSQNCPRAAKENEEGEVPELEVGGLLPSYFKMIVFL